MKKLLSSCFLFLGFSYFSEAVISHRLPTEGTVVPVKTAYVACVYGDKVLIGHAKGHTIDYWNLPGGHTEPSDGNAFQTAQREAREELGGAFAATIPFDAGTYYYDATESAIVFLARMGTSDLPAIHLPINSEMDEVSLLSLKGIATASIPDGNTKSIKRKLPGRDIFFCKFNTKALQGLIKKYDLLNSGPFMPLSAPASAASAAEANPRIQNVTILCGMNHIYFAKDGAGKLIFPRGVSQGMCSTLLPSKVAHGYEFAIHEVHGLPHNLVAIRKEEAVLSFLKGQLSQEAQNALQAYEARIGSLNSLL